MSDDNVVKFPGRGFDQRKFSVKLVDEQFAALTNELTLLQRQLHRMFDALAGEDLRPCDTEPKPDGGDYNGA